MQCGWEVGDGEVGPGDLGNPIHLRSLAGKSSAKSFSLIQTITWCTNSFLLLNHEVVGRTLNPEILNSVFSNLLTN